MIDLVVAVWALIPMFIIYWVVEAFAFRSLEPKSRTALTTAIAWAIVGAAHYLVLEEMGGVALKAFFLVIPAALVAWLYNYRKLMKKWDDEASDADMVE